jgi:nicotinate-nucleotide adenylyltransferase
VRYLDMPLMQVSSTAVRRRVRLGQPIRYLVPEAVRSAIEQHGLYAGERGAAA